MHSVPTAPLPLSSTKTVSWIHIGDTHITQAGEQNEIDLGRIVDEINAVYAKGGVDFVFVPGDIADDGGVVAYEAFRAHLDRLQLPWYGIVGDHDVHEESFDNFRKYIAHKTHSDFSVGTYHFFLLNAFSIPRPDSFVVDDEQLRWLEQGLQQCAHKGEQAVLFLHCYPSELKQGKEKVQELLRTYPVLLVDMGHTHYNEVSNDGTVLYSATRSTGQIEEGPVGYSVTNVDGTAVSWHFVPLDSPSLIAITQPVDDRLATQRTATNPLPAVVPVHAKIWSISPVKHASAKAGDAITALTSTDGLFWTGSLEIGILKEGAHELEVTATTQDGTELKSAVRVWIGERPARQFDPVDHENAIGEWKDRGLLGTQLGPNKNGKKW